MSGGRGAKVAWGAAFVGAFAVWSCVTDEPSVTSAADAGDAASDHDGSSDDSSSSTDGASSSDAADAAIGSDAADAGDAADAAVNAKDAADAARAGDGGPLAANLALWLRADLGVTPNGAKVSAWADQSGSGRDVSNGTTATQPELPTTDSAFGGQLSMRFLNNSPADPQAVGGSEVLTSTAPVTALPAPFTAYFVYRGGDPTVAGGLFLFESGTAAGNDHQNLRINGGASTWSISYATNLNGAAVAGLPIDAIPNATVASAHLLIAVLSGGSSALYLDHYSTAAVTGTLPNATMDDLNLGATRLGQSGLNGAIAEVIVYNGVHQAADRQTIAAYVSSRYGLSIAP